MARCQEMRRQVPRKDRPAVGAPSAGFDAMSLAVLSGGSSAFVPVVVALDAPVSSDDDLATLPVAMPSDGSGTDLAAAGEELVEPLTPAGGGAAQPRARPRRRAG